MSETLFRLKGKGAVQGASPETRRTNVFSHSIGAIAYDAVIRLILKITWRP
jgi:hypothetical protein